MKIKRIIGNTPVIGSILRSIYRTWVNPSQPFHDSNSYWKQRYETGGNSGDGSYNQLAEFKAEIINDFIRENGINSIIEYGSGDGNQLSLVNYPSYTGFDISPAAISMCRKMFSKDSTKIFKLMEEYDGKTAKLTLSLDVIYHLIEDNVFWDYINRLFDSSERFVIIYSSDTDDNPNGQAPHVRQRKFTEWVRNNKVSWRLLRHIQNKYPYNADTKTGSIADFYIYEKE